MNRIMRGMLVAGMVAVTTLPLTAAKGGCSNGGMIGSGIGGKHQIKVYPSRPAGTWSPRPRTPGGGNWTPLPTRGPDPKEGTGIFYNKPTAPGTWAGVTDGQSTGWVNNNEVDNFLSKYSNWSPDPSINFTNW